MQVAVGALAVLRLHHRLRSRSQLKLNNWPTVTQQFSVLGLLLGTRLFIAPVRKLDNPAFFVDKYAPLISLLTSSFLFFFGYCPLTSKQVFC